ncbi:protein-disulfide reductase DsbD [Vibrio sonorensis]|uniref:protein-disulfide reductase DsbD n=1 Tax=Vibrio sonorensis TaxID=1004316 RepID=UPI0008DAEB07|nr:protein-disulfide reductase DsbD [Vibrio sonorensis]
MRILASLLLLLTFLVSMPSMALFDNNNTLDALSNNSNTFVPVGEAFPFNYYQDSNAINIDWQVKSEYYLYQERISISGENVTVSGVEMRDGEPYTDQFFGDVHIYTSPLFAKVTLENFKDGATLIVQYQGCAKAGFCYPPETRIVELQPFNASSDTSKPSANNTAENGTFDSQDASLASKLADNWWTPILFLALGIGLAFTPCVLPMYPILTSIVLGSGKLNTKRALGLSFLYVQGMALTYTLLGLIVASAGLQFQAAMQHPYVLIGLSLLFVALAMSMFGVYTIQLPAAAQTWLNNLSNKQTGGSSVGVFAMGAISGLVCSPCTTAPLSGALLYVAQSGDLLTGAATLYALAIGMGIPLIIVAVFGNKLLPKAGSWMDKVKTLFGFVLLAAPIFLLERILPEFWSSILWSILGILAFGWLYHSKNSLPFGGWKQSALGIIAVLGLFASSQPLLNLWFAPQQETAESKISFVYIETVSELEQQLQLAKLSGKPVMLDFYADWCVACKEFEKYTFHQANVEQKLSSFVLIQADVTKNRPQDIELLQSLNVLGLPTIEFWDASGQHIPTARITGFMPAEPFLAHLQQVHP